MFLWIKVLISVLVGHVLVLVVGVQLKESGVTFSNVKVYQSLSLQGQLCILLPSHPGPPTIM